MLGLLPLSSQALSSLAPPISAEVSTSSAGEAASAVARLKFKLTVGTTEASAASAVIVVLAHVAQVQTASGGEAAAVGARLTFRVTVATQAAEAAAAVLRERFVATVATQELAASSSVILVLGFQAVVQTTSSGASVVHVWMVNPNRDPTIYSPLRTRVLDALGRRTVFLLDSGQRTTIILQEVPNG